MAKTIKTIKCPTCGSANINEVRPDYFKCNSCGTDFFLDNDDININHHHFNNTKTEGQIIEYKTIKKIIIAVLFAFVGFSILNILFSPSEKTETNYSTYSNPTSNNSVEEKITYKWNSGSKDFAFLDKNNVPLVLVVGKTENSNFRNSEKDNNIYWACYDLKSSKVKFIKILEESTKNSSSDNIAIRKFEDENIYVIINSHNIYQIKPDLTIQKLNEQYEKSNADLTIGIAQIKFGYENNGSNLEIVNNEGKQLVYLPLINKTYKKDKFYQAITKTPPNSETVTSYTFSYISDDFPDEKVQLVKYKYKHQIGYPKDVPRFEWIKDYHTYGIIYDNSPYTKRFLRSYWKEQARVISYEILSPNRNFFGAEVLAFNDKHILIKCYATPNYADTNRLLQLLNATNGEIEYSFNTTLNNFRENNYILNDGYIIETRDYNFLDKTGKIINTFDLNKIIIEEKK